ncbi:MAG TPA: Gfo/Idh/MocA family oxidoreductase [Gammaproteobacteria bacterium]|jgi:predicted dehydrogenase|nr:Gfo/Idh/MocA family oxidoreductase [Gammaproteobacteria bacterium]
MPNIAIIGCGLIGQKRAQTIASAQQHSCRLIACVDKIPERAAHLAKQYPHCEALTDWREVIQRADIHLIIIATLHANLAEIALAAVQAGKHILVEKPAGRAAHELDAVITAAEQHNILARVGFNHRYHRAFRKARELVDTNQLGELMFIRARYGHGGRIGYDKEWRADPALSGGGELIDQGVHLIDLARWFLGDFSEVQGYAHTYYWDMPVDDNGFLLLKTAKKQVAHLHASCTEWKNTFSFEIYGKQGKIDINGLGGSYGVERITFYKMLPAMGPPETFVWEYPMADDSWQVELDECLADIAMQRQPAVGLRDAQAALKIVEEVYQFSGL